MVLIHLKNGDVIKINPRDCEDIKKLDDSSFHKNVTRISIITVNGHRVDLPKLKNKSDRVWIELLYYGNIIKGEKVCMKFKHGIFKSTYYYSDHRVVIDF